MTKFWKSFISLTFLAALAIVAFKLVTFTVPVTQDAVVVRFGNIRRVVVNDTSTLQEIRSNPRFASLEITQGKGLFFRMPLIDSVEYFNNRLLTYDTDPREVTTRDKKKLILDNYAQWKITNPVLFRISMKNERSAYTRLDDIIYSKMNLHIGRVDAEVLISDKEYVRTMLGQVIELTNQELKEYGMEVVDVRIKRTDLPQENSANIFNRMRTERERMAKQYRSEGQEEAQKIRSDADKQATIIEAQAYSQAESIKGEGEAEAMRIYAQSYNQDPEFYRFYRTLQAYQKTLDEKTVIVIDSKSEFARYLFGR